MVIFVSAEYRVAIRGRDEAAAIGRGDSRIEWAAGNLPVGAEKPHPRPGPDARRGLAIEGHPATSELRAVLPGKGRRYGQAAPEASIPASREATCPFDPKPQVS